MKALIIRAPHVQEILDGTKTIEYRRRNTATRGRIALIQVGTDKIFGTVDLVESEKLGERRYAWHLANPRRLPKPVPSRHRLGARVWAWVPFGGRRALASADDHRVSRSKAPHLVGVRRVAYKSLTTQAK